MGVEINLTKVEVEVEVDIKPNESSSLLSDDKLRRCRIFSYVGSYLVRSRSWYERVWLSIMITLHLTITLAIVVVPIVLMLVYDLTGGVIATIAAVLIISLLLTTVSVLWLFIGASIIHAMNECCCNRNTGPCVDLCHIMAMIARYHIVYNSMLTATNMGIEIDVEADVESNNSDELTQEEYEQQVYATRIAQVVILIMVSIYFLIALAILIIPYTMISIYYQGGDDTLSKTAIMLLSTLPILFGTGLWLFLGIQLVLCYRRRC